MITEEEKEAIERIDYIQDFIIENGQYNADVEEMQYFSTLLNLITKLQEENEKKDKVIDEMSVKMAVICTGLSIVRENFEKCYCDFLNSDEDCCWKTDKGCSDCIKQYFYRKVENDE